MDKVHFQFINCAVDNDLQRKTCQSGTTITEFLRSDLGSDELDKVLIRVNRQRVPVDYEIQEGDRITLSPTNVEGN